MKYGEFLHIAGSWAAIVTALVAVMAYGLYRWEKRKKRRRLEQHLKIEKELEEDRGQRTVLHLMSHLRLTEADVLDAAFRSNKVRSRIDADAQGLAQRLLFEYNDGKERSPRKGRSWF